MELTIDNVETSLTRAVLISLFTWRRANPGDLVDDGERYGWWGDSFPAVADDRIGSRLWLLRRAKLTADTIAQAELYAQEALAWLQQDGHVLDVEILTQRAGPNRLNLGTVLTLPSGQRLAIEPHEDWQVIYAL
ncbi:phage GP46 family protein [Pseudomonas oryzihabitans]|uniref:phage GP46 family protein n=1 Tax=Pseudomonas oryzihabitans TaxID=47885 RepID=UPI00123A480D|nr:phage GP46 family protein [Pseudomonas oryzihabitans]QEU03083.1 hypothetical protein FOB65_07110 [Pseudomonas oryzihabitans]